MRQGLLLDRPGFAAYLPLILLLACKPEAAVLVPPGATALTIEQVRPWVTATRPTGGSVRQFKWLFQDDRSSAGGVGTARVAAPDTLRFDARGPLGTGRMAALVVGDQPVWAIPEETVAQLVPDYTLLWAMFGVARLPNPRAAIRGLDDGRSQIWEYSFGSDTVIYSRRAESPGRLTAEVRRSGKVFGRVETKLSADGQPISSRLVVPDVPAQLDIQFVATTAAPAFPPDTWLPPEP
jgi:hypothetical protein